MYPRLLTTLFLAIIFLPFSASALLIGDNGPEPIIVQVKESLRQSDELDQALTDLALLESQEGMTVEKRWVGEKYLELLSFPSSFTEEQALAVILKLQQSPAIDQVVAVSATNLVFTSADFAREFAPTELIPEAARRGLDNAYFSRPPLPPASDQVAMPHVPGQLVVRWKDEYVWKAQETGFGAIMAAFNAQAGTQVLSDLYSSTHELTQVLAFDETVHSLADELNRYNDCPWVDYAQPNFLYSSQLTPNDPGLTIPLQPTPTKITAPKARNKGPVFRSRDSRPEARPSFVNQRYN